MPIIQFSKDSMKEYEGRKYFPVFMRLGSQCYEVLSDSAKKGSSWLLFIKIFYYELYKTHQVYFETLFEKRLFKKTDFCGYLVFSKKAESFGVNEMDGEKKACKFGKNAFARVFSVESNNLLVLKKVLNGTDFDDFELFICDAETLESPSFKNDLKKMTEKYKKEGYVSKKAILVANRINDSILTEEEKFFAYVRKEYDSKTLIGDITIDPKHEQLLTTYMRDQLRKFVHDSNFKPDYPKVFAFGLVRYAAKNYNKNHKGEFWPYFKDDYDVSIDNPMSQKRLHDVFQNIMNKTKKAYFEKSSDKTRISNITMHNFVADNSADQLFDYLLDYWRIDLNRNADHLSEDPLLLNELLNEMEERPQNVMSHTAQLIRISNVKTFFKNRVGKMLTAIDECFWDNKEIDGEAGRISRLLNIWTKNPKEKFVEEKNYVRAHSISKEKGEILYRTPALRLDFANNKLKLVLPMQRLPKCDASDYPIWTIVSDDGRFGPKEIEPEYKHDKIGPYVEKMEIEVPANMVLSGFEITLSSKGKDIKKYSINRTDVRFFDENGRCIDHEKNILPEGHITIYSRDKDYPKVLGIDSESTSIGVGLFIKALSLSEGQMLVLKDRTGIQVGQKFLEGYAVNYPLEDVFVRKDEKEFKIYNKLPKLLFKADPKEVLGVSLVINGRQNRIADKVQEFKLKDDLKNVGYMLDLGQFINEEGLYQIFLDYPRMHRQTNHLNMAYFKTFNYEFVDAPYVFEEVAKISFSKYMHFEEENKQSWEEESGKKTYYFNFADRNKEHEDYCKFIKDRALELTYRFRNNQYKVVFQIPSLFWRFDEKDEWNVRSPNDIPLKELKTNKSRMYVDGPFDFSKMEIYTPENVDIADEESKIRIDGPKEGHYFEIGKAFNWFDKDKARRKLSLSIDGRNHHLVDIICKSELKGLDLIGDFDKNILVGEVEIAGNEEYTISIYHNGKLICEDVQIVDGKFEAKTELESGTYECYVYEIDNDDDDGFDVDSSSILLNENGKPLVRSILNTYKLGAEDIIWIDGYQDKDKKCRMNSFMPKYFVSDLKKVAYEEIGNDVDSEVVGIWKDEVRIKKDKLFWYKGKLFVFINNDRNEPILNVLIAFADPNDKNSILIFEKEGKTGEFVSYHEMTIDWKKCCIADPKYCKKKILTKDDEKHLKSFDDAEYYFNVTIEKGKRR